MNKICIIRQQDLPEPYNEGRLVDVPRTLVSDTTVLVNPTEFLAVGGNCGNPHPIRQLSNFSVYQRLPRACTSKKYRAVAHLLSIGSTSIFTHELCNGMRITAQEFAKHWLLSAPAQFRHVDTGEMATIIDTERNRLLMSNGNLVKIEDFTDTWKEA